MPLINTIGALSARGFGFLAKKLDPFFEYVTMLLPGNGTNGAQNNTFLDSSTNNFTITRNGNTTQGTFSPYGANWSNYFDGSGDYLTVPSNANLALGTGDFTLEMFAYFNALPGGTSYANLFDMRDGNFNQVGLCVYVYGTTLGFDSGATVVNRTFTLTTGQWYHIVWSRVGTTYYTFVNGVQQGTGTLSTNYSTSYKTYVGSYDGTQSFFNGYLSNIRVLKGTGVSSVTVPTAPLTAITNTQLLTCQSNRFIDNSTNAFTITRNGDVSVQRFSPFSPSATYSSSVIGGSGYFDGTGDYLSVADNSAFDFGSGNFTIEFWVYYNSLSGIPAITGKRASEANYSPFMLETVSSQLKLFISTSGSSWAVNGLSTATLTTSQWYHIAVSRSGSTVYMFVNGTSVGSTGTVSGALMTNTDAVTIGQGAASISGSAPLNGYLTNFRMLKGTAQYTANFTPPTAPLTAITNTSLLLNCVNAGIIDNAMMNDLETVGNAQISTAQSKFGGSSMYFDGTGDWLLVPHTADQLLGTGNFTIECWLYLGATGAARGVVGKGTATTGWLLSTDSSNKVVFTYGSSTITSTAALSGSTWYHIAVVREGTGTNQTKIYIGGTNDGTGTVSTDFTQTNAMYVGANRTGGDALNGYIDDLRITKGVARYTANFTPPAAAFPTQ